MNEELREKLAWWVGFGYDIWLGWIYPDGENFDEAPNFPESLDACFKWLVPEVYERYGQQITQALLEAWAIYIGSGAYWRKEAEVLCLAIEKLVDGEK